MKCKKCGSENVKIDYVSTGSSTKVMHTSMIRKIVRLTFIFCTVGIWALIFPKKKESGRTKVKNQKKGICQDCGYSWNI